MLCVFRSGKKLHSVLIGQEVDQESASKATCIRAERFSRTFCEHLWRQKYNRQRNRRRLLGCIFPPSWCYCTVSMTCLFYLLLKFMSIRYWWSILSNYQVIDLTLRNLLTTSIRILCIEWFSKESCGEKHRLCRIEDLEIVLLWFTVW